MGIRTIKTFGASILRQEAKPVEAITPEIHQLIDDMILTMEMAPGVGLAAPQIGRSLRIIVVTYGLDIEHPEVRTLINPEIVWHSEKSDVKEEGCLSVPDTLGNVRRWAEIRIDALDGEGQKINEFVSGITARIIQHEIDHLNGTLFIDHLSPIKQEIVKRRLKKRLQRQTQPA